MIKRDPNRYALCQSYPTEGGVYVSEQIGASLPLPVRDAAGNALDMALDHRSLADQVDASRIADLDTRKLGFFEIALHMEAIAVNQSEDRVIAWPDVEISHEAVDQRPYLGPRQIERGNIAAGESLLVGRLRLRRSGVALLSLLLLRN